MPLTTGLLMVYIVFKFVPQRFWSFEDARYLLFTEQLPKSMYYIWLVRGMAVAPVLLLVLWVVQIIMFDLQDQWHVLQSSIFNTILLLFALDKLCRVPAVHNWHCSKDFEALTFYRPFLHLVFGTNVNFSLKLTDAVFSAMHGDKSRLERYLPDPTEVMQVVEIFRDAERKEVEATRIRRDEREQRAQLG